MCGICGVVGEGDERLIRNMTGMMVHRGPDDEGVYRDPEARVMLGVRRLSIIDLEGGHQPISNEDGSIRIVFNGEIYNYRELREALGAKGHVLKTRTDTEVIVHLYEEYGEACVHALRGMFAFAIWDARGRRLLVARDRLGIKPLYYWIGNGQLLFASEMKTLLAHPAIPREVDRHALYLYLAFQYVPAPLTMVAGIRKLPPGHLLIWENSEARIHQYWDITFLDVPRKLDAQEAVEELRRQLREAVRLHLIADVPVGALLSGGLDSSLVVGLAAEVSSQAVKTFTVGFDVGGSYNELEEARLVAKRFGTDHHEVILNASQAQELLPKLIWHLDEPLADQAALPTYLICEFASRYVKVVLTGEGGDELFGGYPRYGWFRLAKRLQERVPAFLRSGGLKVTEVMPVPKSWKRYAGLLLAELGDAERYLAWVANFSEAQKRLLFGPTLQAMKDGGGPEDLVTSYLGESSTYDLIHTLMYLDMKTWLVDDILTKVDKMSMAVSLEARVPLLDHKLVEFMATLPSSLKIKGLRTKFLLKRTAEGFLPATTIRRKKHAFLVPVAEWLRGGLRELVWSALMPETSPVKGYFDQKYIQWMVEEHIAGRANFHQQLWGLLCFVLWHHMFINTIPIPRSLALGAHWGEP